MLELEANTKVLKFLGDALSKAIAVRAQRDPLEVVQGEWRYEGKGWYGTHRKKMSVLAGRYEGRYFAVRVPSTITTVYRAVERLMPEPVREAEHNDLPVRRQGSMYFRPMRIKEHDMKALSGTRHQAKPRKDGGLTITHPEHRPVILSGKYKWRAYPSKKLRTT